jgi:ferredoxin
MADRDLIVPENVRGRYFVDATCIDCELCRELAPRHFSRQDEAGYSFVAQQPVSESDESACLAALEECPVEAIGRDDGPRIGASA